MYVRPRCTEAPTIALAALGARSQVVVEAKVANFAFFSNTDWMANGSWLPWWPKSWNPFSRSKLQSYDYDSRLASLAEDIETVELTLIDIKVRKRRAVSKVLQVMLTTWVAVLALLWGYASLMHSSGHADWAWSRSMFLVGLVVGTPILLVVLHRVISLWFRRMEKAQEAHLQALRKQRRDTINEIKKVTDFEHLRQLLNRYDTENPVAETEPYTPNASQSREALGLEKGLRNKLSLTSLRAKPSKEKLRRSQTTTPRSSRAAREEPPNRSNLAPAIVGMPISGVPSAPAPRGWMDKVADVILGTDPFGATPEDQQYALICRSCFHHNGLVPKNEFSEIRTCAA